MKALRIRVGDRAATREKPSYSGGGEGDACVEVARRPAHLSVRDSEVPSQGVLTFRRAAFGAFVDALRSES